MRKKKEAIGRLEETLMRAYREQSAPAATPDWRRNVMRDVRRSQDEAEISGGVISSAFVFRQIILPSSSLTGLVAAALLLYAFFALPSLDNEIFTLLTVDTTGIAVASIFRM